MIHNRADIYADIDKKYAILIDAENISPRYIKIILDEISDEGIATYKRIYADWTADSLNPAWKEVLLKYSFTPMQQYGYTKNKNSTDSAMIIDAMDIMYAGKVDGICIASSDSDFTRLAVRLREEGMTVIGMGEEKTPQSFTAACTRFLYIDGIYKETKQLLDAKKAQKPSDAAKSPQTASKKADDGTQKKDKAKDKDKEKDKEKVGTALPSREYIKNTIIELITKNSDDDGRMHVSALGNLLSRRIPTFDVRNYAFSKLWLFLKSFDEFVVSREKDTDNKNNPNGQIVYIKLKSE